MLGITSFTGFLLSAVLLNLTPGADTIYILSKSATGGRKRGVVSALGISSGILVHTLLASLGLSVVLARSAFAFNALKWAGAVYLVAMGIKTLLQKGSVLMPGGNTQAQSLWAVYRQGVLTNVLNPKVALFFLSLLPQFVQTGNSYGPLPFLLLGLTFTLTSTLWSLVVASLAGSIAGLLQKSEKAADISNKVAGLVYIGLGLNVLRAKA